MKDSGKKTESNWRSILSLVLFAHLFAVFTGLLCEPRRSGLERRLFKVFSVYLRPLHLVPDSAPVFLTHGNEVDDDHLFEIEFADGTIIRLPGDGSRWQADRRRFFRLGRLLALMAESEEDSRSAEIAGGIAASLMVERGEKKAVIRCKHRMPQPLNLGNLLPGFPKEDPTAAAYDRVIYEADILHYDDGTFGAAKRATKGEVAPARRNP